jgi:hypothetical protein
VTQHFSNVFQWTMLPTWVQIADLGHCSVIGLVAGCLERPPRMIAPSPGAISSTELTSDGPICSAMFLTTSAWLRMNPPSEVGLNDFRLGSNTDAYRLSSPMIGVMTFLRREEEIASEARRVPEGP